MQNNRKIGSTYEAFVAQYLEDKGYRIVATNYRIRQAEIDIIAYDKGCLVFAEVKYRKDTSSGHPLEAVTHTKMQKIGRAALAYMQSNRLSIDEIPVRFDVIGVVKNQITHITNAFDFYS